MLKEMKYSDAGRALMVVLALLAVSCSTKGLLPNLGPQQTLEEQYKEEQKKELIGLDAYQKAGGRIDLKRDNAVSVAGALTPQSKAILGVTSEEDTVWAPYDPDESIGEEFDEVWNDPENTSWHEDLAQAGKIARSTGKPVILWFTRSGKSPQCNLLNEELMLKPEFESWAKENTVRVTLDIAARSDSQEELDRLKYVGKMKKRFNARGYPSVYILSPSGEVVDSIIGYKKGNFVYYWGQLKHSVEVAARQYGAWREGLEKRGYRMWISRNGVKLFAKLYRYDAGRITLIEPSGKRGVTSFNKLSDADQSWVLDQKAKRDQSIKDRQ